MSRRIRAVDLTLHRQAVVEIPLHDQLPVPVDVDTPRTVVTDPGQEDVPAPPDLGHPNMLPNTVTLRNQYGLVFELAHCGRRWPGSCAPGILVLLERGAKCRTPKAGSSTTPTPTSWRRRCGSATTRRPGSVSGCRCCATRVGTSCARPAAPRSNSAICSPPSSASGSGTARTSTEPTRKPRSCSGRTSRRPGGSSPRTGPARSTCSASPAS